jgi:16S rRNA (adenine1518-N6/adenine1519-N6)-dimethyltransferase
MKAKKSLGQHFLNSVEALESMVSNIDTKNTVIEIGPGTGNLTEHILKTGANMVAIETDSRAIPVLNNRFKKEIEEGRLEIIEGDILETNLSEITDNSYEVIANIPYYISGAIFRHVFSSEKIASSITLLIQKEVAERIVSKDSKESILSLSIKAYGSPEYIMTVPAKDFSPVPRVDSAILRVSNISRDFFIENDIKEEFFFSIIKTSFGQKRKTLVNNLKNTFDKDLVNSILEKNNLSKSIRPEEIDINLWINIIKDLNS